MVSAEFLKCFNLHLCTNRNKMHCSNNNNCCSQYHDIIILACCPLCPVVVRCDCVGGLQWRTDPLPCYGPTLPHPAAGGRAETRETSQRSMCHRDVSAPSLYVYCGSTWLSAVHKPSLPLLESAWLKGEGCHVIHYHSTIIIMSPLQA